MHKISFDSKLLILLIAIYPICLIIGLKYLFLAMILGFVYVLSFGSKITARSLLLPIRDMWPIWLFVAFSLGSYFYSLFPGETLRRVFLLIPYLGFAYLGYRVIEKGDFSGMYMVALSTIFSVAIFFLYMMFLFGSVRSTSYVMTGEFGSFSNVGSALLVVTVPYVMHRVIYSRKKIWSLFFLVSTLLLILMSTSRGAFIFGGLALFGTLLYSRGRLSRSAFKGLLIGLVIIGITGFLIGALGLQGSIEWLFERILSSNLYENVIEGKVRSHEADYLRSLMYIDGIEIVKSNPVLGIGYGTFYKYMEKMHGYGVISHNLIITAWSEIGLHGLLAFILLTYLPLKRIFSANSALNRIGGYYYSSYGAFLSIGFLVVMLHGMFRPQFDNPFFWIQIGAVFGFVRFVGNNRHILAPA